MVNLRGKVKVRGLAQVDADIAEVTATKEQLAAQRDALTTRVAQQWGKKDMSAEEVEYGRLMVREEAQTKRLATLHKERESVLLIDIREGYRALCVQRQQLGERNQAEQRRHQAFLDEQKVAAEASRLQVQQAEQELVHVNNRRESYLVQRGQVETPLLQTRPDVYMHLQRDLDDIHWEVKGKPRPGNQPAPQTQAALEAAATAQAAQTLGISPAEAEARLAATQGDGGEDGG